MSLSMLIRHTLTSSNANASSVCSFLSLAASLFFICFLVGCGGSSSAPSSEPPPPPPNRDDTSNCNTSLASYISNLHVEVPSWDELSCFTATAERLTSPSFVKRMLQASPQSNQNNVSETANNSLAKWHEAYTVYGANVSSALIKSAPPFVGTEGEPLTYPLTASNADLVFRSAVAMFMHEKQLGRPVVWVNFYPIDDEAPTFAYQAEFESWVTNELLPEKVLEAQAAEVVKAEYYIPFPIEFEIFFKKYTGYTNGGFADSLSQSELLTLAQSVIDQIHDAVRPHFNGKIIAHLYNAAAGDDLFLQELSYSQYDEFFVALFPQCDIATTERYVDEQINYYMTQISRDGLPWQVAELTVQRVLFDACDNSAYETIEADIYTTVFDKIDSLELQPIGIQIGTQDLESEAAKQVIIQYFSTK